MASNTREGLYECVNVYINKNWDIIKDLEKVKIDVKEFNEKCNIAKTVGTTTSVAGTAATITGIFLAPFTAGLSLGLTIGGIVSSVGGAATNITTSIVDYNETKDYFKIIESKVCERMVIAKRFSEMLVNLNSVVDELVKKGVTKDEALDKVLYWVSKGSIDLASTGFNIANSIIKIYTLNASLAQTFLKSTGSILTAPIRTLDGIVGGGVLFGTRTTLASLESEGLQILARSGGQVMSTTTANAFKAVSVVGGVVFAAIDIGFLIHDWTTPHTLIKSIDERIVQLNQEISQCNATNCVAMQMKRNPGPMIGQMINHIKEVKNKGDEVIKYLNNALHDFKRIQEKLDLIEPAGTLAQARLKGIETELTNAEDSLSDEIERYAKSFSFS